MIKAYMTTDKLLMLQKRKKHGKIACIMIVVVLVLIYMSADTWLDIFYPIMICR